MPNDQPEPLAAVLAEFRAFALRAAEEDKMISPESVLLLADKVEAAAERERDEDRQLAAIAESDEAFARCARCDRPERAPGNAAATRKFDEAAFDDAVSKPNGWSDVADPVAEIRRMRDGDDPGNAAALREALEEIYNEAQNICDYCDEQRIVSHRADKIERIVNTALAAPARNCDRFKTAVEAMEEWGKYPQSRYKGCRLCPHGDASMVSPAHLTLAEWLFAPAKGGDHA